MHIYIYVRAHEYKNIFNYPNINLIFFARICKGYFLDLTRAKKKIYFFVTP